MKRLVYVDNAATTPISKPVLDAMLPYLKENYGNPSSIYSIAQDAKQAIEDSRAKIANAIGCEPGEVYFTSCGTESDNWAIKGAAKKLLANGKNHLISTTFEHHAVLHTLEHLKREGFDITLLPVDKDGLLDPALVKAAIKPETALVSVMYANNEIGTIQSIAEIGAICKEAGVWFHTDAVQAMGNVHIDVKAQNIDLMSFSGHKINAPKGVGGLYIRKGVALDKFMDGGAQENNRRGGTENVAGIVALGKAVEDAATNVDANAAHLLELREAFLNKILTIERTKLNGDRQKRLPGNANISFEGIEGEGMLLMLDMAGICASSGSACTSGSLDPSHVLLAIGLPHEIAHGSLRVTFGHENTIEDVDYLCETLPPIVERLRSMSPVWEQINKNS